MSMRTPPCPIIQPRIIFRRTNVRDVRNKGAALGRVGLALIFVLSGIGKVAAPDATVAYVTAAGLPFPHLALWVAAAVEIVGGVALALGFQARIAAVALAGFSIVAAIFFHADFADQNQMIHFMKNIAIAGGLLQVAVFGAGSVSLDGRSRNSVLVNQAG
jgi:putative oxidoreductase